VSDAGALLTYAPDMYYIGYRAAWYVDRVLKAAKPGDLPVETPKKFELVINLKTANEIGLTIPPEVLILADKIIR
jgi:putative tryptophan/tyrosine transport system substrate-binding protein